MPVKIKDKQFSGTSSLFLDLAMKTFIWFYDYICFKGAYLEINGLVMGGVISFSLPFFDHELGPAASTNYQLQRGA